MIDAMIQEVLKEGLLSWGNVIQKCLYIILVSALAYRISNVTKVLSRHARAAISCLEGCQDLSRGWHTIESPSRYCYHRQPEVRETSSTTALHILQPVDIN